MSDIISQAMGILGGSKKDRPVEQPKVVAEQSPARPSAPARVPAHAHVRERLSNVERKVVGELARFASLHAQIIEIRQRMERGDNHGTVESLLEETLRNAKVTIR